MRMSEGSRVSGFGSFIGGLRARGLMGAGGWGLINVHRKRKGVNSVFEFNLAELQHYKAA